MPFILDWDGHVHSGFCPHGEGEPSRAFVERALEIGLRAISFNEHFPLPPDLPPVPTAYPVAMQMDQVEPYLNDTLSIREEYAGRIDVRCGFEWDYLPDFEDYTKTMMDTYGPRLQDGILSIHFMKNSIIDETAKYFMRDVLPKVGGTLESAYREYYMILMMLVKSDLGKHKPKRIGHMNIIRKFQLLHPMEIEFRDEILEIVKEASVRGMQLDLNMSGIRRPYCGEPYVPLWLIEKIAIGEIDIECVFGSDAHRSGSVGKGLVEAREII